MRYLLDTHIVIWAMVGSEKLSEMASRHRGSNDGCSGGRSDHERYVLHFQSLELGLRSSGVDHSGAFLEGAA